MMKCRYLKFDAPRREGALILSGAGVRETMNPGIIDRPQGTGDRLLMYFHTPVTIALNGVPTPCPAQTLMLWGEGAGHYYGTTAHRWSHSWLHFHGADCAAALAEHGLGDGSCFVWPDAERLEWYLFAIFRELTTGHPPEARLLRLHWEALLLELERGRGTPECPAPPPGLLRVRRQLDDHPERNAALRELAVLAGVSVPTLCAGFRRHFGLAPIQYRLERRFELAQYLLRDRNLTIQEVARRVGYADPFQFSRMFRRRLGLSPRASRSGG